MALSSPGQVISVSPLSSDTHDTQLEWLFFFCIQPVLTPSAAPLCQGGRGWLPRGIRASSMDDLEGPTEETSFVAEDVLAVIKEVLARAHREC